MAKRLKGKIYLCGDGGGRGDRWYLALPDGKKLAETKVMWQDNWDENKANHEVVEAVFNMLVKAAYSKNALAGITKGSAGVYNGEGTFYNNPNTPAPMLRRVSTLQALAEEFKADIKEDCVGLNDCTAGVVAAASDLGWKRSDCKIISIDCLSTSQ